MHSQTLFNDSIDPTLRTHHPTPHSYKWLSEEKAKTKIFPKLWRWRRAHVASTGRPPHPDDAAFQERRSAERESERGGSSTTGRSSSNKSSSSTGGTDDAAARAAREKKRLLRKTYGLISNVVGTPGYWNRNLQELVACVEAWGVMDLFLTLTCNEVSGGP